MPFRKQLAVELLLITAIGLILGLMGPFGSYVMPMVPRIIYWIFFGWLGYCFFRPINYVADWLFQITSIPEWASIAISTGVASFPLTILIGMAIGGMQFSENPMLQEYFPILYAQVAGLGVAIFLIMRFLFGSNRDAIGRFSEVSSDDATAESINAREGGILPQANIEQGGVSKEPSNAHGTMPALQKRLPEYFASPICALSVEDHYVRVYGEDGKSEMILLRFADAMSEMTGVDGMQVHRSWWVADTAIKRARRDGRKVSLILNSGLEIPVSRSNIAAIKAKAWL